MDSVKEYFSIKPVNDKPEPDYKVLYEQVKAERDIAFSQLEALGTSFGEKEDAVKERMEGNVLHHLTVLLIVRKTRSFLNYSMQKPQESHSQF